MKVLLLLGGVAALLASIVASRMVLHAFTDHGHLDSFHLVVAIASAVLGLAALYRALATPRRTAST